MTTVTPRTEGDPRPDTLGMRLAHRVLLRDARRLTALAESLAARTTTADPGRGAAIGGGPATPQRPRRGRERGQRHLSRNCGRGVDGRSDRLFHGGIGGP